MGKVKEGERKGKKGRAKERQGDKKDRKKESKKKVEFDGVGKKAASLYWIPSQFTVAVINQLKQVFGVDSIVLTNHFPK